MIGEKLNDAVVEFEEEIEKLKSANAMYGEIQNLSEEIKTENQAYKKLIENLSLLSKEITSSLKKGNTLLRTIEKAQKTVVKDLNESIEGIKEENKDYIIELGEMLGTKIDKLKLDIGVEFKRVNNQNLKEIQITLEEKVSILEQNLKTQLEIQDKKIKGINLFVIINLLLVITNIIIAFIK